MQDTSLADLLQHITDVALILLDADGRIVHWSTGAEQIFGYAADEVLGSRVDRLFTADGRERGAPMAELETATRQGRAEDDRWMLRKDGLRFWANGFTAGLRRDGELLGFAKILRDRTDLRAQIEALRNRADALAAADTHKAVLIAKLAHELRNPVGVLSNAAQLVDGAARDDQRLAYPADLIKRQTAYLSRLVESLLELARSKSGKRLRSERVELSAVLEDAIESVGERIRAKNLAVDLSFLERPLHLDADPARLKQVFVNLLDNAAKFSPQGGRISIYATVEADEAVVQVIDEGCGIDAQLLPRVFELFTQAESSRPGDGLGLGLAIVRENVELHGGTVQVRSEGIGRGSRFRVRLPLRSK